MKTISFAEFQNLDLRIGRVLQAERIPESRNLIRMRVDLGEKEPRNILAGIAEWYQPKELVNKSFIFVANLEPKKMMGEESQGMILCGDLPAQAGVDGKAVLIPASDLPPGTVVR
jgi:methionine--tRNA ligase beta chain